MNIYEIGEEKCIDGVWGREFEGRFYTYVLILTSGITRLARLIDLRSDVHQYIVLHKEDHEVVLCPSENCFVRVYKAKPIKYELGDIVWVVTNIKYQGKLWSPVVYLGLHSSGGYCVNEVFNADGFGMLKTLRVHKEVFLKPPFDF